MQYFYFTFISRRVVSKIEFLGLLFNHYFDVLTIKQNYLDPLSHLKGCDVIHIQAFEDQYYFLDHPDNHF